jgi:hypothetical protein
MTGIAVGVAKKVSFKKQSGLGVPASGAGGAYLRRVTSTIDLAKQTYKSAEILPSMQRRDFRHGVKSVAGTVHGEISAGAYQAFIESILRQVSPVAVTPLSAATFTAAATTGAAGTFTATVVNFLTAGFKVGDIVSCTGWTVATANNAHNFLVIALTGLVMTVVGLDGLPPIARVAGDSVTFTAVKKTWIPQTAQSRDYYTIEHAFTDIVQSEQFTDCVITTMALNLPATGIATADFGVMGLGLTTGTTQVLTTPSGPLTGGIFAAVNGALVVGGNIVGFVTGLTMTVTGNYSAPGGVVGANVDPDIFPGSVDVTGQATVYFLDGVMRGYFLAETEVQLIVGLAAGSLPGSGAMAVYLPRVKFAGATKDDGEKGLILTMPFTALEQTAGGVGNQDNATTIQIADTTFV